MQLLEPVTRVTANDKDLNKERATEFRGTAARANYLAQDRPDIQYTAKEICRHMAHPRESSQRK